MSQFEPLTLLLYNMSLKDYSGWPQTLTFTAVMLRPLFVPAISDFVTLAALNGERTDRTQVCILHPFCHSPSISPTQTTTAYCTKQAAASCYCRWGVLWSHYRHWLYSTRRASTQPHATAYFHLVLTLQTTCFSLCFTLGSKRARQVPKCGSVTYQPLIFRRSD